MAEGALVTMRFKCSHILDHADPDWEAIVHELIAEEGIIGLADDCVGEIVSIEKCSDAD